MKILLAEDDPMLGAGMDHGLRQAGFAIDWCRDGRAAELAIDGGHYDLLLLDLGLPRLDGLTLLKKIRQSGKSIPVLIVTARDAVGERITGLNLGADDYLVKPFDLEELIARMRALLRRSGGRASAVYELAGLSLDPTTREVTLNGAPLRLSQREFSLLEVLLEQPGKVYSRQDMEERLYGWGEEVSSNTVEVHVHNLRRKLGKEWIRNVRGVGYKLVAPGPTEPR